LLQLTGSAAMALRDLLDVEPGERMRPRHWAALGFGETPMILGYLEAPQERAVASRVFSRPHALKLCFAARDAKAAFEMHAVDAVVWDLTRASAGHLWQVLNWPARARLGQYS
jgi:hypothetical protein